MRWHILLVLLLLLHLFHLHLSSSGSSSGGSKCTKLAPSFLTQEQKEEICSRSDTLSIGPAMCASLAHKSLHYAYPAILSLCFAALSDAPADCVVQLKKAKIEPRNGTAQVLKAQGDAAAIDYCRDSRSELPATCLIELSKMTGKNKLKDESIYEFCHSLESDAPLVCVRAAILKAALLAPQALIACVGAVCSDYNATSTCVDRMMMIVDNARESSKVDRAALVRYCSHTPAAGPLNSHTAEPPPSPGAACYSASSGLSPLSPEERLALCDSSLSEGPVLCMRYALATFNRQQGSSHSLPNQQAISLCARASNDGPAVCYDKSRDISAVANSSTRLALCAGAGGSGPSACFKRAFKSSPTAAEVSSLRLCVGAADDGPAQCLTAAPRYLSIEERVELCHGTPVAAAAEPGACILRVEQLLPSYRHVHKRVLGSAAAPRGDDELAARAAALQTCSYSGSAPLASALCLKDAPRSMQLLDALHMCRASTCSPSCAAAAIAAARDLSSQELATLCGGVSSCAAGIKAARCVAQMLPSTLRRGSVLRVCSREGEEGGALACALEATKGGSAVPPSAVERVCGAVAASTEALAAGQCLARAPRALGSSMEEEVLAHLCLQQKPLGLLGCLGALRAPVMLRRHIDVCAAAVLMEPYSARVLELISEDDTRRITAGRRFSLLLQLYDQWGQRAGERCACRAAASIDAGNAQGAVLWGAAPNASSAQGLVRLNHLMITQPGTVKLRIYCSESKRVLALLSTSVEPDLRSEASRLGGGCAQLFAQLSCPVCNGELRRLSGEGADAEGSPRQRGQLPSGAYLLALACSDTLHHWRVSMHCSSAGEPLCWMEYRPGIEALWTGVGLPSADSPPEQRLQLPEGWQRGSREGRSALRRAYRQASLQWHPDRWAEHGLAQYASAVRVAFQLVAEAYESLSYQGYDRGSQPST